MEITYSVQLAARCFSNTNHRVPSYAFTQGGDCLSLLSSVKRLPEHVAQHFIAQISLAVKHLHTHGVIHRDIKPDNVMVSAFCCDLLANV